MKSNCFVRLPRTWLQAVLLGAVVLAIYLPTRRFSFVYDDHWTIQNNSSLDHVRPRSPVFLDADTAANPASGISRDVYRPLSTLSFAVNKAVFNSPGAFHLVNVFMHAVNVFLLWVFLRRKTAAFPAFAASLLYAVHPLQIESVAGHPTLHFDLRVGLPFGADLLGRISPTSSFRVACVRIFYFCAFRQRDRAGVAAVIFGATRMAGEILVCLRCSVVFPSRSVIYFCAAP